jgi:hypothetical protein
VIDVDIGSFRQRPDRLARDHHHLAAAELLDPHALGGELAVGRLVLAEREQGGVLVGGDGDDGGVHGDQPIAQDALSHISLLRSSLVRVLSARCLPKESRRIRYSIPISATT